MKSVIPAALTLALSLLAAGGAFACDRVTGAIDQQFASWVNDERRTRGLPPLRVSPALTKAATAHSCDMAQHGFMSHQGSKGSTLKSRLRNAGYRLSTATENVAKSSRAPGAAVIAGLWAGSPGHAANLMNPTITEMGFSAAQSGGMTYYTFVGAKPR